MANGLEPWKAVPTPKPARTLGVLNLVFGICLVMYSTSTLLSLLFATALQPALELQEAIVEPRIEAAHRAELQKLSELEAEAESDLERETLRAERESLERVGPLTPPGLEIMTMGISNLSITRWSWLDSTTSILLNLMLILSGVGLLQFRPWGRTLGLWVAGIKLARLPIVWGLWIGVVVPDISRQLGDSVQRMMAASQAGGGGGGGGLPAGFFTQVYGVMYTVWGIVMIVFGSIYPVILLWVLRKPGIKAACRSVPKPQEVELS